MLTYVDAGVLIYAIRGKPPLAQQTLQILLAPERRFAASRFLEMELLPKPLYFGRNEEVIFYRRFFDRVDAWATNLGEVVDRGLALAAHYGLSAIDALHIAAALTVGAEEFVTAERPTSPLCRVTELRVISLYLPPQ